MQLRTFETLVPRQPTHDRFLREAPTYLQKIADLGITQVFFPNNVFLDKITVTVAPDVLIAAYAAAVPKLRFGVAGFNIRAIDPYSAVMRMTTLHALYPGRVDTAFTLANRLTRMDAHFAPRDHVALIEEMVAFHRAESNKNYPAFPLWQVASSIERCRAAGQLGLGLITMYTGPEHDAAIAAYREASAYPRLKLVVPAVCAETTVKAEMLTSTDHMHYFDSRYVFTHGTPATVKAHLVDVAERFKAEIIVTSPLFNIQKRLEAYALLARECAISS